MIYIPQILENEYQDFLQRAQTMDNFRPASFFSQFESFYGPLACFSIDPHFVEQEGNLQRSHKMVVTCFTLACLVDHKLRQLKKRKLHPLSDTWVDGALADQKRDPAAYHMVLETLDKELTTENPFLSQFLKTRIALSPEGIERNLHLYNSLSIVRIINNELDTRTLEEQLL